jgi:hypothetical protein
MKISADALSPPDSSDYSGGRNVTENGKCHHGGGQDIPLLHSITMILDRVDPKS